MPSVWAIGDIHGKLGMLEKLLEALPRGEKDYTVFIGDYIDRGEDSAGVVQRVLSEYDAKPDQTILLWGNHEDMAASYYGIPAPSNYNYDPFDWFGNGGIAALESFGLEKPDLFTAPCPEDLRRLFSLLKTYWKAPQYRFPDIVEYVWVHAGLKKGQLPEEAGGDVLLWIREEFLDSYDASGRVVIHGHTPMKEVIRMPDKIGIDTGAVYGGSLSALQLPENVVYQVDQEGKVTQFPLPVLESASVGE